MKYLVVLIVAILASLGAASTAQAAQDRILSWECPTTREDGTSFNCLTEAEKFVLEVQGPAAGNLPTYIDIPVATLSRIINSDAAGTLYRIKICDLAGLCSDYSNQVKKPLKPGKVTLRMQ